MIVSEPIFHIILMSDKNFPFFKHVLHSSYLFAAASFHQLFPAVLMGSLHPAMTIRMQTIPYLTESRKLEYLDYLLKNSSAPFLLWHINSEQIFNKAVILSINNVATNKNDDKQLLPFHMLITNNVLLKSQYPTIH